MFWLGNAPNDVAEAQRRAGLWFGAKPETDSTIRDRFSRTVEAAGRGEFADWLGDARSALALVIVLDLFPLHIWSGTARAFAFDVQALEAARHSVAMGYLAQLAPIESAFLILPYQHSQSIERQRGSVQTMTELARTAASAWRPLMDDYLRLARYHLAIIERFGRFRTAIVRSADSPRKTSRHNLAVGGATFGQG